jgi:hypothetical protein
MINWQKLIRALLGEPEPDGLKDFESINDLRAWFELHDELRMPAPNLCDDYARESQVLAEMDGYRLSCCLVAAGVAYMTPVFTKPDGSTDTSVYHIANMAIVNNGPSGLTECWYIDLAWGKCLKLCDFVAGGKY